MTLDLSKLVSRTPEEHSRLVASWRKLGDDKRIPFPLQKPLEWGDGVCDGCYTSHGVDEAW
jgi:hypothetical protein